MRARLPARRVACAGCLVSLVLVGARSPAGELDPPPGALGPTMKPLTDVEPRIAVNAENTPGTSTNLFVISQPGSYYLAGNLEGVAGKNGIYITTDNVTLDLNGFALIGVADSKDAIWTTSHRLNVCVRNGTVTGWGGDGVSVLSDSSTFEDLRISQCGGGGLINFNGFVGTIRNVGVYHVGTDTEAYSREGIFAGQYAIVEGCTVRLTGGDGIKAGYNSVVRGCNVVSAGADGIYADERCVVESCRVSHSYNNGIRIGSAGAALRNIVIYCGQGVGVTDGAGILAASAGARIEGNHASYCDVGIRTATAACLVVGNSAGQNSVAAFDLATGTLAGPTITSANILTEDSAHANYAW